MRWSQKKPQPTKRCAQHGETKYTDLNTCGNNNNKTTGQWTIANTTSLNIFRAMAKIRYVLKLRAKSTSQQLLHCLRREAPLLELYYCCILLHTELYYCCRLSDTFRKDYVCYCDNTAPTIVEVQYTNILHALCPRSAAIILILLLNGAYICRDWQRNDAVRWSSSEKRKLYMCKYIISSNNY